MIGSKTMVLRLAVALVAVFAVGCDDGDTDETTADMAAVDSGVVVDSGEDAPDAGDEDPDAGDEDPDAEPAINPVDDETLDVIAQYPVEGNVIVGDADEGHRAVWDRFAELFRADLHPEINLFVAIDVIGSGGTDGAMQVSAANPDDYYLALDVSGEVEPDELDRTMVHEFGHLLTLRPSQVPRDLDTLDDCEVFADAYGCPAEASYLTAYFVLFWPDFLLEDLAGEDEDAADLRFQTGEFVTEYAATIPTEDIAEVFAEWVKNDESPQGDTVLERKLRFFDDYAEVVEIRAEARAALGLE